MKKTFEFNPVFRSAAGYLEFCLRSLSRNFFVQFIFISCFIFLFSIPVLADCYTGFACSLKDLQESQRAKDIELIHIIQDYFTISVNSALFFKSENSDIYYNDLFIFNTIV